MATQGKGRGFGRGGFSNNEVLPAFRDWFGNVENQGVFSLVVPICLQKNGPRRVNNNLTSVLLHVLRRGMVVTKLPSPSIILHEDYLLEL